MARKVLLSVSVLVVACLPAVAIGSGARTARVTVKPSAGSPTTRFVVSFRAPERTGRVGAMQREYVLDAGDAAASGCNSNISMNLPRVRAHARIRVVLDPARLGGNWCPGVFHGQVEEIESPVCPKGLLCPAFVALLRRVGRFSFHVRPAGGDVTAPNFAGLQHAFACTPGAQRPGETTPFTLSWQAATDNVTPSAKLVYDVFESSRPGGEDFSGPTWTAAPGATSFKTPGLASHGTFYFVVRARDQAGNEDRNRVERRGADPCY